MRRWNSFIHSFINSLRGRKRKIIEWRIINAVELLLLFRWIAECGPWLRIHAGWMDCNPKKESSQNKGKAPEGATLLDIWLRARDEEIFCQLKTIELVNDRRRRRPFWPLSTQRYTVRRLIIPDSSFRLFHPPPLPVDILRWFFNLFCTDPMNIQRLSMQPGSFNDLINSGLLFVNTWQWTGW